MTLIRIFNQQATEATVLAGAAGAAAVGVQCEANPHTGPEGVPEVIAVILIPLRLPPVICVKEWTVMVMGATGATVGVGAMGGMDLEEWNPEGILTKAETPWGAEDICMIEGRLIHHKGAEIWGDQDLCGVRTLMLRKILFRKVYDLTDEIWIRWNWRLNFAAFSKVHKQGLCNTDALDLFKNHKVHKSGYLMVSKVYLSSGQTQKLNYRIRRSISRDLIVGIHSQSS